MLPRVILIGDSIRMGYQHIVAARLAGRAVVWGPMENGGNSANVLAHLEAWALSRPADLVHINCGLHDLRHEFGSDANVIPLAQYVLNVRLILSRLREASDAQIVWANTTPVNQARHHSNKSFDRFEEDVRAYNVVTLSPNMLVSLSRLLNGLLPPRHAVR